MAVLRWQVTGPESGQKLIDFLKNKVDASSNRELKRKIEANLCRVNEKPERFASTLLKKGDLVTFFDEPLAKAPDANFDSARILWEDAHYVIYDKQTGFVCDQKQLANNLFLTHRLDKETTGVLVIAKTKEASEMMQHLFHQRQVRKSYLALVDKVPRQTGGIIENTLGKLRSYQGNSIYGEVSKSKGHLAITKWQLKDRGKKSALLLAQPITGRTHQIRVHFSGMGHPILGDYVYGQEFACPYRPERILLHAYQIQFIHPITQERLEFTAPLPSDFEEAKRALIS